MGNSIIHRSIFSQIPNKVQIRHKDLIRRRIVKYTRGGNHYAIPYVKIDNREKTDLVFVYFHGNSEDLADVLSQLEFFSVVFRATVYCCEYVGFGVHTIDNPELKPSEENMKRDAIVFLNFLRDFHKPEHTVLYGRSLGSTPALHAASHFNDIGAVILESAFLTPMQTVLQSKKSINVLNRFSKKTLFDNQSIIKLVESPIFLLHGENDKIVPFKHCLKLALNAHSSRFVDIYSVQQGNHNNLWQIDTKILINRVQQFLSLYDLFEKTEFKLKLAPKKKNF